MRGGSCGCYGRPMPAPATVADLLRRHRSAIGLSQRELARRSGLSERALRDLERGASMPRLHSLRAIAGALGLTGSDRAALLAARTIGATPSVPMDLAAPLPAATDLIGRQREMDVLVDLVTGSRHRLITLLGPAGIGKSTLAGALVETLRQRPGPEALAVDLSALTEPALVGEIVLEAVAAGSHGGDPVDRIAATLRGRRLVLVLDRMERLTAAAPVLAAVVRRCPGLTLLVTSQRPLRVSGERLVRLHPLLPPDAVRLFAVRAAELTGSFELTTGNAQAVAAVCAKVEYLPLAIELAAARTRVLTPADLDARLASRLAILTDGAADRPARHRSLRAAIESSLDLITGPGRTLFGWLGGFAAGCRLDDLEAVAARLGLDSVATITALTELVDTGLVRLSTEADAEVDQTRYTLPDMVAELALEHLAARADRAEVEAAVAGRFLDRLRSWQHQPAAILRLTARRDVDNLRAALTWTIEHRPTHLDAALVDLLGRYFEQTGRFVEGDTMLRRIGAAGQPMAWIAAGRIGLLAGQLTAPAELAARALDELADDDDPGRATALLLLGTVAAERRDAAQARRHLRAALRHARRADDDDLTGRVLNNLGNLSTAMGQVRAAEREYGAALVAKRRGDAAARLSVGHTLANLAELALKDGRFDTAAERAAEAADLLVALGYPRAAALARSGLALALVGCGRTDAARTAIEQAESLLDDVGDDRRATVVVTLRRSVVVHAAGDAAAAGELLARTIPHALRGDHTTREETAYLLIAHAERLAGCRPAAAAGLIGAATALIDRSNRPMPPHQAYTIEQTRKQCRQTLGPPQYAVVENTGSTLHAAALATLFAQFAGAT
jgi:predicted ATPase/transcriptional regulator with XRE-family HTH domain